MCVCVVVKPVAMLGDLQLRNGRQSYFDVRNDTICDCVDWLILLVHIMSSFVGGTQLIMWGWGSCGWGSCGWGSAHVEVGLISFLLCVCVGMSWFELQPFEGTSFQRAGTFCPPSGDTV